MYKMLSKDYTSRNVSLIFIVLVLILVYIAIVVYAGKKDNNTFDNYFEARFAPHVVKDIQNSYNSSLKEKIKVYDSVSESRTPRQSGNCTLPAKLTREINSYQNIANQIISTVVNGSFKGRTYRQLAYFVDKFGSRLFGTDNLESSIDFMVSKMKGEGLENVHGEKATIPRWIRGKESATLIYPRKKKLTFLGLGFSVGTHPEGIIAEVLVVRSFDELRRRSKEAKGKIIIFNQKFEGYRATIAYRGLSAGEVAKVGGVAALIRSITPFSINSPHAGVGTDVYNGSLTQIPTACITIEDAELLNRLQCQGEKLVIELKMADYTLPLTTSRNIIGEIKGREKPDEVVIVSGHIDSWDVGQGALDDGGGILITVEALALLKFLNLTPRRTIRAVLWTAEEAGYWGVRSYVNQHSNEMDKLNAVFESDHGTFSPLGLDFAGNDSASCVIQEVLKLLAPINATTLRRFPVVGTDIFYFIENGVPGLSLNTNNIDYYAYQHSEGDTMTLQNSDQIDLCTAVWAVSSFVLADLSVSLPRS